MKNETRGFIPPFLKSTFISKKGVKKIPGKK